MTTESAAPPAFCAAHLLSSWDERHPQSAVAQLAGEDWPIRPDGVRVPLGHRWVAEDIEIRGRRFAAGSTV
jgi:hypothetical protein